jgi:hypothetical protein
VKEARVAAALWLIAAAVHALWALTIPEPQDWDPAYYRTVARHVADGQGAVTSALWNLLWLPDALPFPADTHWMPLPSRALVPFVWAWPAHGDRLATIALGAAWAPLAWALARRLGADGPAAISAGLLAATGLLYARFLSTPDSIAIYGVIGGLAFVAAADGRWKAAAALAAAAALTRNDGFLLAPCLALAFPLSRGLVVAAAGPLAALAWHLRNVAIVGDGYWAMRAATSNVVDSGELVGLVTGDVQPLGWADRLVLLETQGLAIALFCWLLVLPAPSLWVWSRRERWVRAAQAYWLVAPILSQLLAPGVAASGSVFRSSAALFPLACAAAVMGLDALGRWSRAKRGYPRAFVPVVLGGAVLVFSYSLVASGASRSTSPLRSDVCDDLVGLPPGEPVFSAHPLLVEAHCDRPAVVLVDALPAENAAALASRYGVRYAVVAPDGDGFASAPRADDMARLLPGWVPVRGRLWASPEAAAAVAGDR